METVTKNILVTGVGGPAGINTARLLKQENGVHVVGCDIDENSTGKFFVDIFLICPRASDGPLYEKWIRETVEKYTIDVLIPTVHDELPVLSTFCDDLPCEVIISKSDVISLGDDKKLTYEWAAIHLPHNIIRNVLLSEWTEAWSSDNEQFIKPRKGRGARGCKVVTKDELVWLKAHTKDTDSYIVMENMPGTEWTVDAYVGRDGALVYAVARERMGLAGGISIKGRTVQNKAVLDATKTMLDALQCRGPVCIQWKEDREGTPRLIEINPRLSGGLLISVHAGVNPISNILKEHKGEKLERQEWNEVTVLGYYEYTLSK